MSQIIQTTGIQDLLKMGRYDEAERRLRDVCAGSTADAESWFMLGALSGMRGNAVGAEDCFRKALALRPGLFQARFNLAIALRDQDRFDEARVELEAVIATQPGHAEAHNALGYVFTRLERPDEAERCFHAALARNPVFPDALTNLGNVLSSRGRWQEAVRLYRRALEAAPGNRNAALNLGSILVLQDQIDEAIAVYTQLLHADQNRNESNSTELAVRALPTQAEVHVGLGLAFMRRRSLLEAERAFRQALVVCPNHPEARYLLAALGGADEPLVAPPDYVARLFDDYAEVFDTHLVEKLKYRTPEALFDAVQAATGGRRDLAVLDLGCGTGLCGSLFRSWSRTLAGVDLSPKMIAKARARGVYDKLDVAELTTVLRKAEVAWDLVIAADVFVYIGDLSPVFEGVVQALRPGGTFSFSVEAAKPEESGGYILRNTGRYAHAQGYVAELTRQFGFVLVSREELCIRQDGDQAILGSIYVLRRTLQHDN